MSHLFVLSEFFSIADFYPKLIELPLNKDSMLQFGAMRRVQTPNPILKNSFYSTTFVISSGLLLSPSAILLTQTQNSPKPSRPS